MENCAVSSRFFCFREDGHCSMCNVIEIERLKQLVPKTRTVGELMTILSQYPRDTKVIGVTSDNILTDLVTVQANCPDGELDNVMICYYESNVEKK